MKRNTCCVCGGDLAYDCGEWRCTECGELNDVTELYSDYGESTSRKKREKDPSRKSKEKKSKEKKSAR